MAKKAERIAQQIEHPATVPGNVGVAGGGTQSEHGPHFEDHDDDHTHHVSLTVYFAVFATLMVLLAITVGAYYIDLGHFNTPLAVGIAATKAIVIMLFFMHVKFSSKMVRIFAFTAFVFVGIMFMMTFNDYFTRGWLPIAGK